MGRFLGQAGDSEYGLSVLQSRKRPGGRTRITVDLGRFEGNVRFVHSRLPEGADLLPVIKANAYGHGLLPVLSSLVRLGIGQVAVMGADEGVLLREAGFKGEILLLGGFTGEDLPACLTHALTPVLHHAEHVRLLESRVPLPSLDVHVKIDSGMGRLGFLPGELPAFLDRIVPLNQVKIRGLMTHFPLGEDPADTESCFRIFRSAIASVLDHPALDGLEVVHAANSAAVMSGLVSWATGGGRSLSFWARPGLLLYGHFPMEDKSRTWDEIRPVQKVEAQLLSIRTLPKGQTVSYGRTCRLDRDSRVGVIGMGYADGLPRGAGSRGWVTVSGKRAPFLGRICMDMVSVDLTDLSRDLSVGDWVPVINPEDPESMTVDMLASWTGTIAYEILCSIGHRAERRYAGGAFGSSFDPL